jgi:hypothetical protein
VLAGFLMFATVTGMYWNEHANCITLSYFCADRNFDGVIS